MAVQTPVLISIPVNGLPQLCQIWYIMRHKAEDCFSAIVLCMCLLLFAGYIDKVLHVGVICRWHIFILGNAMHAVRTQCEVLNVGQYSDPTFGPF